MDTTRCGRSPSEGAEREAGERLPLRAIALTCAVLGGEQGEALLEGLTPADAQDAQRVLREFRAQTSPVRQAWLSLEFGPRPDADARVRRLLEEASWGLRRVLARSLPPYQRSLMAGELPPVDGTAPGAVLVRLAARLVREATR